MAAFNFHRRRTRRWWYAGATLVAAAFFTVFFVAGAGAVTGSPSGFESGDGNMVLNDTTTGNSTDWNCFYGQTAAGFQSGTPNAKCKVTSGATQVWADGGTTSVGSTELEIKPGSKFDDPCITIQTGNNPPKDEWTNVAEYTEASSVVNSDGGHDVYFYGASIRPTVNGNSSGNIYFFQNGNGCHTPGDLLIAFDFLAGGGTPSLHALFWLPSTSNSACFVSSDSPPCWSTAQAISSTNSDGNVNTSQIDGTANAISGATLPANAFAEFGVNLTQAIKAAGGTLHCFANETWVSRSSGSSFSSNPEDVEVVPRPTCGKITIIKHTLNAAGTRSPGVDQSFDYTTPSGGLTPATFSLNDKDGTDTVSGQPDSNNTQVYSNVPPGSYTVNETLTNGAPAPNFAFVSLTCTHSGTGTTAAQDGTTSTQADITLGIAGSAVCTYTNKLQLGAIRINKTSSKGTKPALSGAKFFLCTNNTTSTSSCTAPSGVTNPLTTDANGTVCQASLPFATYYVFESAAPSGYAIDDATAHSAAVSANGDCSSSTSQSVTLGFTDTPLSQIYLGWHSLAGTGVTTATVQCTGEGSAAAFSDGGSTPAITKTLGDGTSTLAPGTYTCTIVIDP